MANFGVARGTNSLVGIADTNALILDGGDTDITQGLDQHALTEGLAGISVPRTYTGRIGGGSAGSLLVDVDSGAAVFDYNAGGGSCQYRPNGDDNLCKTMWVRGMGKMYVVDGGTINNLLCSSSYTSIGEAVVVDTTLRLRNTADVKIGYNATTIPTAHIYGGRLTCARGIDTLNVYGNAEVTLGRENLSLSTTPDFDDIVVINSKLKLNTGSAIASITLINSVLDLSDTPASFTLSALSCDPWSYKNSKLVASYSGVTVTISATTFLFGPQDGV